MIVILILFMCVISCVVRALSRIKPKGNMILLIEPQMSLYKGHQMKNYPYDVTCNICHRLNGKSVLEHGEWNRVLAILAAMKGAINIDQ